MGDRRRAAGRLRERRRPAAGARPRAACANCRSASPSARRGPRHAPVVDRSAARRIRRCGLGIVVAQWISGALAPALTHGRGAARPARARRSTRLARFRSVTGVRLRRRSSGSCRRFAPPTSAPAPDCRTAGAARRRNRRRPLVRRPRRRADGAVAAARCRRGAAGALGGQSRARRVSGSTPRNLLLFRLDAASSGYDTPRALDRLRPAPRSAARHTRRGRGIAVEPHD